jgi:hypothetical protein
MGQKRFLFLLCSLVGAVGGFFYGLSFSSVASISPPKGYSFHLIVDTASSSPLEPSPHKE